ncbi:MAG TPA: tetratricopeptide repeat protein, partial [Verrucomicrobiae bacterium]|nr:tetratricopeptide repeat protein [Verrucomicrobiae bacterium]
EMVGPFGSTSVFGTKAPPMCLVRAGLWLRTTRTGQLLDATTRYFQRADGPREWTGMELMAGQAIRPGSKATQRVYQNFETNLREILTVASRAHVPVILCTVASNLRDCPPFASLHREGLSSEQLNGWRGLYEEGVSAQMAGDAGNALNLFMKAAGIDDEFADLAFRRAECSLEAGRLKDAAAGFQDARDKDALQFRADTEINKMIRNAATAYGDRGVRLLDAESFLVSHSANGVPGADFFYEHVHFTPEGNYELSRAVADEAARALSLPTVGDWLSGSNCFRALGLTDWNRFDALNTILDRIQSAPFTAQLNHTNQVEKIRQSMANLKFATKPAVVKQQALEVSRLADKNPDDPDLRWNLAILMQNAGDYAGAEQQWRALQELQPQSPLPGHNLAQLLEGLGRTSEAPNR